MDINNFVNGVNTNISNQTAPNTISPLTVGSTIIDLANITKSNIESGDTRVTNLTNTVSGNTSNINNLQTGLTQTNTNLNGVKAITTGNTVSITNLTNTVTGNTASINNLTVAVSGNTSAINVINSGLTNVLKLDSSNNLNIYNSNLGAKKLSLGNIEIEECIVYDEVYVDGNNNILYYVLNGIRYPQVSGTTSTGNTSITISGGTKNNYATFAEKARTGQAIKGILYGSSIAQGDNGAGNADPDTSKSLENILKKAGLNATVTDGGVNGRDSEGTKNQVLGDSVVYDFAIVEQGGNDRNNNRSIGDFKNNLYTIFLTLIARGSWVIAYPCVDTNQAGINPQRQYYKNAFVEVATELNIPLFDASLQTESMGMRVGNDRVHYNDGKAYPNIANGLSHFFLYEGQMSRTIYPRDIMTPTTYFLCNPSGEIFPNASSANGYYWAVKSTSVAYCTFYLAQRANMYFTYFLSGSKRLEIQLGDGNVIPKVVVNTVDGINNKVPLFNLEKGWHTVFFTCTIDDAQQYGVAIQDIGFDQI